VFSYKIKKTSEVIGFKRPDNVAPSLSSIDISAVASVAPQDWNLQNRPCFKHVLSNLCS